jgi:hypothetical protein
MAQNIRVGETNGKRLLAVPMVGAGTWEDPKRPAFVRESGVPFRYQVSDDGTMALVEASPRNLAEMGKLDALAEKEPRAKVFRPEKDRVADVVAEFKKLKRDFDVESFARLGAPVKAAPVVEPAK